MAKAKAKKKAVKEEPGVEVEGGEGAFVVDLAGVDEDGDFPVLPRALYNVSVASVAFVYSQASGNPMWTWQLEVLDGDYAEQKLFYHTVFTDKGIARVKKALMILGMDNLLEGEFNPEEVADSDVLVGKECRARVDIQRFEGRQTNSVKSLVAADPDGGGDFV